MYADLLTRIAASIEVRNTSFVRGELSDSCSLSPDDLGFSDKCDFLSAHRVVAYHFVTEGEVKVCLQSASGPQLHQCAKAGDVVLLPLNRPHRIEGSAGARLRLLSKAKAHQVQADPDFFDYGKGGNRAKVLLGFMACAPKSKALLDMLPELSVIHIESITLRRWVEASIKLVSQLQSPSVEAHDALALDVSRQLLLQAISCSFRQTVPSELCLSVMGHPRVSQTLLRIHRNLAAPLRVVDLAREAGMSRSAFVELFTSVCDVSPRRYILNQRMEAAAKLLCETSYSIAEVGHQIGYEAPEAFSRAFKREIGFSPAEWRQSKRLAA